VHQVGFIITIYHDARSPERQIRIYQDARSPKRQIWIYHDARSPERQKKNQLDAQLILSYLSSNSTCFGFI